ncbi:MAG: flagellin [bacterium]|nr:flagellin [bacterium]
MYATGISNMFGFGLRQLAQNQHDIQTSLERLSTGKQVNRAADDPSGIVAIEQHEAEIYSLNKELDAISRHESYLGAKEGGLSVLSDFMIELESIVVQAANSAGNTDDELAALQDEANAIIAGIDNIARTTTFNGQSVMQEYTSTYLDEDLANIADLLASDPEKAQEVAEDARNRVSTTRAAIGGQLKEMDSRKNVIGEQLINLNASLSSIQDTDIAKESAKLVRAQILESATIAAIDISRQSAQQMIGLLENNVQTQKALG